LARFAASVHDGAGAANRGIGAGPAGRRATDRKSRIRPCSLREDRRTLPPTTVAGYDAGVRDRTRWAKRLWDLRDRKTPRSAATRTATPLEAVLLTTDCGCGTTVTGPRDGGA